MGYDEGLAGRVRDELTGEPGLTEKRMFGGLAFLVDGHLAVCASSQGGLMVRVDPAETDELIRDPAADRFIMRGRELDGWLHVRVTDGDESLARWAQKGVTYARSLPPKS